MEACIMYHNMWKESIQAQNLVELHDLLLCARKIIRLQEQTGIYQINMT